jgi:hypothetical protein
MKPLFQFLGPFGSGGNINWRNAIVGSPASSFASQCNPFAHSPEVCLEDFCWWRGVFERETGWGYVTNDYPNTRTHGGSGRADVEQEYRDYSAYSAAEKRTWHLFAPRKRTKIRFSILCHPAKERSVVVVIACN